MKKIAAIAGVTWKSAFRYRFFWVLCVLLAFAVIGMPLIVRDDGTAEGMVQILLTYTLSATATILALATLWLSCGTLARDIEECQAQMVVVKPIARWQVWLGKWVGILFLDAVLLALAGTSIFIVLQWRASRMAPDQRKILQEDIFVSRASAREPPTDFSGKVEELLKGEVKDPSALSGVELEEKRLQIRARLVSTLTDVPPGYSRRWCINLHSLEKRLGDKRLQLRVKFLTGNEYDEARYMTIWRVGPPNSTRQHEMEEMLPANSFQEINLPDNILDDEGRLWVEVGNPYENRINLTFPMEDGMELLYPESTFAINFVRGLTIIFCWLALLASIGLAAASFLSFPVASFVSVALLFVALSSSTLTTVVEQGSVMGYDMKAGGFRHTPADYVMLPLFSGALKVIKLVRGFSPIDSLSSGRSITWGELGLAFTQIILVLGGFFCAVGMIVFTRRELATAQGNN